MFYVSDDDLHCDLYIRFTQFDEAIAEIRRRVALPWDHEDNQASCIGWETCERQYWTFEYGASEHEVRKLHVATISAGGVV